MTDDLTQQLGIRDQLDAGQPASDRGPGFPPRTLADVLDLATRDAVLHGDGWVRLSRNDDGTITFLRHDPMYVAVATSPGCADTITIPKPAIHTGPKHLTVDQATAQYLREVADRVRANRYWGSGVTALVASVVENVANAVEPRCACGTDATSLNPAEVVVHRPDSCYIADAVPTTGSER